MMKKSRCWVCQKKTKWFYENVLLLRTKHSEKSIRVFMENIFGRGSKVAQCSGTMSPICFKCVDRINKYEEACEKLEHMRQELMSLMSGNMIIKLQDDDTPISHTDNEISATEYRIDAEEIAVDGIADDSFLDRLNGPELKKQSENIQEDPIAAPELVDEPVAHEIASKEKKRKFSCKQCDKLYGSKQGLMMHTMISHVTNNSKVFECPVCHKSYHRQHLLESHVASNCSTQKNFKCSICPKRFSLPYHLKAHKKEHGHQSENSGPFDCNYCGLVFENHGAMTAHEKLHLNKPKFQCLECDRILSSRSSLKEHMMIHSKAIHFLCDICAKSFNSSGAFSKHIRRHYSELNAQCYICKHRVISMDVLKKHMLTHTGTKPHPCSECGKRFALSVNRDTHYRLHFGPTHKPHRCTMCTEAFARPGLLSKHYFKAHGVEVQPKSTTKMIKVTR